MELRESLRTVDALVECRSVVRDYRSGGEITRALDGVSMECLPGRVTVISGASGSGKSTLLGLVAGLDRADDGLVLVAGADVGSLSRRGRRRLRHDRVTMVLPQPSDNLFDHLSVGENVTWSAARLGRVVDPVLILDRVALGHRTHASVRDLSGGEQQRVAIAVAIATGAPVLAADEPTASLDRQSAALVIEALRAGAMAGVCVLVATHDEDVIRAADDVVRLDHGRRVA